MDAQPRTLSSCILSKRKVKALSSKKLNDQGVKYFRKESYPTICSKLVVVSISDFLGPCFVRLIGSLRFLPVLVFRACSSEDATLLSYRYQKCPWFLLAYPVQYISLLNLLQHQKSNDITPSATNVPVRNSRSTNESAVPVTEPRTFIHIRACPSFRIINPFFVVHDAFFATETSSESIMPGLKSARGGSGRIGPLLTSRTRTQLPCFGALLAPQLRATLQTTTMDASRSRACK